MKWINLFGAGQTKSIVAQNTRLYQLRKDGSIWIHAGNQIWEIASSGITAIAASPNSDYSFPFLFEQYQDGSICAMNGVGGQKIYDKGPTKMLVPTENGLSSNFLYLVQSNGVILGCWWANGKNMTGWLTYDKNPKTIEFAAEFQALYQLHNDGTIWQYTGGSSPKITDWKMIDNNPKAIQIVCSNPIGNLWLPQ